MVAEPGAGDSTLARIFHQPFAKVAAKDLRHGLFQPELTQIALPDTLTKLFEKTDCARLSTIEASNYHGNFIYCLRDTN